MVHAPAALALLAPLLLALGSSSRPAAAPTESALRKCRNTTQKTPVYFVDGRLSDEAGVTKLVGKDASDASNVLSVEVSCLNPLDSTLLDLGSMTLGLPAIVVWTKAGPYRHLTPTLKAVRDAQTAFFTRTGKYSTDLASLQLAPLPAEIKLTLDATTTGWSATASIDRKLSPRCRIWGGDASADGKGAGSCS